MKKSPFIISTITIFIITWLSIFQYVECQRRPSQNRPQESTTTPRNCDNIICTTEYNPLCARRNGATRTFSNRCMLNRENLCADSNQQWQVIRLGMCAPILQPN